MKKTILVVLLAILLIADAAMAMKIKGTVYDAKSGEPLIGANVVIKGTKLGATSDPDGVFEFEFTPQKSDFWIEVRFIGYTTISQKYLAGEDLLELKFYMEEDVFNTDEVVVTGIASKTSKAIAEVAVSSVKADQLTEETSYQDFSQMVSGKVAGMRIEQASGNVAGGFRFNVRSSASLNGDEQPVIYVDGVRIDNTEYTGTDIGGQGMSMLAAINPEDIENVQFLKGAAGAASYGTDGSNGVVLITTKQGKKGIKKAGKPVTVRYKYVLGQNVQSYDYEKEDIISADTANSIYQDGLIQQHTIGVSGGTNLISYYLSFDRRNEEGIVANNAMDRKTFRVNVDAFPQSNLTIRAKVGYTKNTIDRPINDNNILGYLGNTILTPGSWVWTGRNAIEAVADETFDNRFIGSFSIEYSPITDLAVVGLVGIDEGDIRTTQMFPINQIYPLYNTGNKTLHERHHTNINYDLHAEYNREINSDITNRAVMGMQLYDRKYRYDEMEKSGFLTELITNFASASVWEGGDDYYSHTRTAGIFFEDNLSYKDQYYFTFMIRRDYASSVGEDAPNIYYPKFSFALRLDKYDFFPRFFQLMKVRAAYGETGNLPAPTDGIPLMWTGQASGFGVGAVLDRIGNKDIEPERVKQFELGFDTQFLNNYSFEFTYYYEKAEESIIDFPNPPSSGQTASSVPFNIGESKGWGIESMLEASFFRSKNFQLDISFINNYSDNEVVDLGGSSAIFDGFDVNVIEEGIRKHAFYVTKVLDGVRFDEEGAYIGPNISAEREEIGSPVPDYTGSFSVNFKFFKNFNLYCLADWATGMMIYNNTKIFQVRFGNVPEYNQAAAKIGLSNPDFDGDGEPDVTVYEPGTPEYKAAAEEYAKMDWHYDYNYIEDADYFKIREISLRYSFKDLLKKYNMDKYVLDFNVAFTGRNLMTFTKYDGPDPEVNFDGSRSRTRGADFLTMQHPRVYSIMFNFLF